MLFKNEKEPNPPTTTQTTRESNTKEPVMNEKKTSPTLACKKKTKTITKALWFAAGLICLVLGAIGMALPILPTTPFLLASAACFCKSSSKMYNWLLNNKWFGEYIKNYREGRGLPMKTKTTALTVLWITIGFSTVFLLNRLLPPQLVLPMQLIMIAIATGVTIYILRLPTYKRTAKQQNANSGKGNRIQS